MKNRDLMVKCPRTLDPTEAEEDGGSTVDVSEGGIEEEERLAEVTEVDDDDYLAEDAGALAPADGGYCALEVLGGVGGDVADGEVIDGGGGVGDEEDGAEHLGEMVDALPNLTQSAL
ncbi:hypothetical protein AAC387_Pa01g2574 [Persea americana]